VRAWAGLRPAAGATSELMAPELLLVLLLLVLLLAIPALSVNMSPWRPLQQQEGPPGPVDGVPPAGEEVRHGPVLCADLVVPPGNECTFLLPLIQEGGGRKGLESTTVSDTSGSAILRATYRLGPLGGRPEDKRLVLRSAEGDEVFAFCRDAEPEPGAGPRAGLLVFGQAGAPFGVLRPDGPGEPWGYSIRAHAGGLVRFRGDWRAGSVHATDENGCLVAFAQAPSPQHRQVRIGPQVDAGLATLALLGIDLLELEPAGAQQPRTSAPPRGLRRGAAPT